MQRLHWHGAGSGDRAQFPSHHAAQFPGTLGNRRELGLFMLARNRRGLGSVRRNPDPRTLDVPYPKLSQPAIPPWSSSLLVSPLPIEQAREVALVKGSNIKSLPEFDPLPDALDLPILLKMPDDVSTDEIMPAGAKALPYRSNLQKIADFSFERIDPTYVARARAIVQRAGHAVIAGKNYGQGSSREHAAAAPRYLGLRIVIAKSFARIHRQNLINYGILPLLFVDPTDYDRLEKNDTLRIRDLRQKLEGGGRILLEISNVAIETQHGLTSDQIQIILDGGVVNHRRNGVAGAI